MDWKLQVTQQSVPLSHPVAISRLDDLPLVCLSVKEGSGGARGSDITAAGAAKASEGCEALITH